MAFSPDSVRDHTVCPVSKSQTMTRPAEHSAATFLPSGLIDTETTVPLAPGRMLRRWPEFTSHTSTVAPLKTGSQREVPEPETTQVPSGLYASEPTDVLPRSRTRRSELQSRSTKCHSHPRRSGSQPCNKSSA